MGGVINWQTNAYLHGGHTLFFKFYHTVVGLNVFCGEMLYIPMTGMTK